MCTYYPYQPQDSKSNLDSTLGKVEMEKAAATIIKKAQEADTWNIHFSLYSADRNVAYGMELLAGYGWLMFLPGDERWTITPEFIKRVCQNNEDRDLHRAIQDYDVKPDDYSP